MNRHFNARSLLILSIILLALLLNTTGALAQDGLSISIPALGVQASIIHFPLNGVSWDIDPWTMAVGHLQGTAWFGEGGNIALGAHSLLPDFTAGTFVALHTLKAGDEIIINTGGGEIIYRVSRVTNVGMNDLTVLYPTDHERITLITCDANSYDPNTQLYYRRHIVTATRIN